MYCFIKRFLGLIMLLNLFCVLGIKVNWVKVIVFASPKGGSCSNDLLLVKIFSCTRKWLEGLVVLVALEGSKLLGEKRIRVIIAIFFV